MPREYIRVRWQVDTTRLQKRLRRLEGNFGDASTKALNLLGDIGKTYAKSIAPRDTGTVVRNIHFRTINGQRTVIFANDPFGGGSNSKQPVRYPGRGARRFQLVRWMHTSGKAASHIKTGDEKFMYSTFDYVRRRAPGIVESEFNKVIVKNN
jgi:hypothetical protein